MGRAGKPDTGPAVVCIALVAPDVAADVPPCCCCCWDPRRILKALGLPAKEAALGADEDVVTEAEVGARLGKAGEMPDERLDIDKGDTNDVDDGVGNSPPLTVLAAAAALGVDVVDKASWPLLLPLFTPTLVALVVPAAVVLGI